jgi:hypothetical protein
MELVRLLAAPPLAEQEKAAVARTDSIARASFGHVSSRSLQPFTVVLPTKRSHTVLWFERLACEQVATAARGQNLERPLVAQGEGAD